MNYIFLSVCLILHAIFTFSTADAAKFDDPEYKALLTKVKGWMREPRNYGPTPEEKEAMERAAAEERLQKEAEERDERERRESEEAAIMRQRKEEWVKLYSFNNVYEIHIESFVL